LLLDEPLEHFDAAGASLAAELLAGHLAAGGLAVVANPSRLELPGVASRLDLGR
jgi:ABC-type transport system involved in cytochrome c biogenesis ATPase subunit